MIFSFGALLDHRRSILASARKNTCLIIEIWEHSQDLTLKCKFGHHLICASYYFMQIYFMRDDIDAGIKAADLLFSIKEVSASTNSSIFMILII